MTQRHNLTVKMTYTKNITATATSLWFDQLHACASMASVTHESANWLRHTEGRHAQAQVYSGYCLHECPARCHTPLTNCYSLLFTSNVNLLFLLSLHTTKLKYTSINCHIYTSMYMSHEEYIQQIHLIVLDIFFRF